MARMPRTPLTHATLAQALLDAVRSQPWHLARDQRRAGAPFTHPPSLDLAVAAFVPGQAPAWANVLFSRELPQGHVAHFAGQAGSVSSVTFQADIVDAQGVSVAWQPHSDWSGLRFPPLFGEGAVRFVAPYPASLIKLMVAVGVAMLVDARRAEWHAPWRHAGHTHSLAEWAEPMITLSSNEATDALVALLHARGLIRRQGDGDGGSHADAEVHNELHALFARQGLATLRLANTRADGGWRNTDGAGVGQLQMTAWDSLRLLWRLQDDPAPWLAPAVPGRAADAQAVGADAPELLSRASRVRLMGWLAAQQRNEVLSSSSLTHVPGWQAGIQGRFAHKTGTTETYASDAGRVELPGGGHFLIAVLSSLGSASAPHPDCAADGSLPRLGAAVEQWLREQ